MAESKPIKLGDLNITKDGECLTVDEVARKIKDGDPQFLELGREIDTSLSNFAKEDRSFDCRLCGQRFTPAKGQWIFYNLCDSCHGEYQQQRPMRTFVPHWPSTEEEAEEIKRMNVGRFESCDEWLRSKKESQRRTEAR